MGDTPRPPVPDNVYPARLSSLSPDGDSTQSRRAKQKQQTLGKMEALGVAYYFPRMVVTVCLQ